MLKRKTRQQLLRDLIARGAPPADYRRGSPLSTVMTLLLLVLALYWLTQA